MSASSSSLQSPWTCARTPGWRLRKGKLIREAAAARTVEGADLLGRVQRGRGAVREVRGAQQVHVRHVRPPQADGPERLPVEVHGCQVFPQGGRHEREGARGAPVVVGALRHGAAEVRLRGRWRDARVMSQACLCRCGDRAVSQATGESRYRMRMRERAPGGSLR